MSNRQLGWDEKQVKDRIAPRELAEQDKQAYQQQQAELNSQPLDNNYDDAELASPSLDKDRIEAELNRQLSEEYDISTEATQDSDTSHD